MVEKSEEVRLVWGVASHPQAQQTECGDAFTVQPIPAGFLVAVIDGLGHGRDAARAAQRALERIHQSAEMSLPDVMRACHQALVGSRGAAISMAQIDMAEHRLTWVGVGNVEGVVVNPPAGQGENWRSDTLVVRGGVVGYDMPHLQIAHVPFGLGAVLAFATDGIKQGFISELRAGQPPQETADRIMSSYDRGTDDALVLVLQQAWGGSDHAA
jgi:negative regulator of sigma-B (phosphoserine phosphatase)